MSLARRQHAPRAELANEEGIADAGRAVAGAAEAGRAAERDEPGAERMSI